MRDRAVREGAPEDGQYGARDHRVPAIGGMEAIG